MAKGYSKDLRARAVALVEDGESRREAADLRANGPDVAQSYHERAATAAGQIAAPMPQVLTQIGAAHDKTVQAISQSVTQASQSLATAGTQVSASLTKAEHQAVGQLHRQVAQQAQQLNTIGEHATAALNSQGRKAASAGDARISGINRQLAGVDVPDKQAPAVAATASSSVQASYQPPLDQVAGTSLDIQQQIGQAGATTVGAIDTTGPTVAGQTGGVVKQNRATVHTQTTAISKQLTGVVTQTQAGGSAMVKDLAGGLDTQLATLDQAYVKGLGDYRQGLDKQVAKGLDDVREPVSTLT